jgi:hypothetical protein
MGVWEFKVSQTYKCSADMIFSIKAKNLLMKLPKLPKPLAIVFTLFMSERVIERVNSKPAETAMRKIAAPNRSSIQLLNEMAEIVA